MLQNRKKILVYLISAILIIFLILGIVSMVSYTNFLKSVDTFEECAATGAPIMESYPEQCRFNGKTYTRQLSTEEQNNLKPPTSYTSEDYYGSSTGASCTQDSDCVGMGCNSEICGGKNKEQQVSICIYPERPTPDKLGYSCGCLEQKCAWKK